MRTLIAMAGVASLMVARAAIDIARRWRQDADLRRRWHQRGTR